MPPMTPSLRLAAMPRPPGPKLYLRNIDPELSATLRSSAAALGISIAEYLGRLQRLAECMPADMRELAGLAPTE